jgi:hypothetical protein
MICLTPEHSERMHRTHETFYCPNGHSNYFPGRTAEQKQIDSLKKQVQMWRDTAMDNSDWADYYRLQLRTCPLCGYRLRSRPSLERHLRAAVADGGHGAEDVDVELVAEIASAHRQAWPVAG